MLFRSFYIDFVISIVYDTLEKYGVPSQRVENLSLIHILSYTTSPVHTQKKYVEMVKELKEMGASTICIKDMAGIGHAGSGFFCGVFGGAFLTGGFTSDGLAMCIRDSNRNERHIHRL